MLSPGASSVAASTCLRPWFMASIFYTVSNNGILTVYDAKAGTKVYQQRRGRFIRGLAGNGSRQTLHLERRWRCLQW
jgi:hypothetical protein